jgi:hypothetical protein
MEAERSRGPRLSLWDGPYALVASPLRAADLAAVIDGFARAEDQRDEVDLVVLDDPDPEFEALARTAGIVQRVAVRRACDARGGGRVVRACAYRVRRARAAALDRTRGAGHGHRLSGARRGRTGRARA